jgi:L-histidine N-alpha-methyltransferase
MRANMTVSAVTSPFASDVRHYLQLTPRQLPSVYLYDALGSALFDAICELPWYGITRAEMRLLTSHRQEVFGYLPALTRIVELGPGDGRKLRTLVEGTSDPLTAHLVDVSAEALARATHTLSDAFHVTVVTRQDSFESGLDALAREIRESARRDATKQADRADRTLVLFLGSNVGNFDPPAAAALLRRIRASLEPGDAFLLGADLLKPERDFLRAYDDPLGVSAAFNLNILLRINRELGGNFDIRSFRHRAVWNADCSRMEMFLVARRPQHVRIEAIDLDVDLGEGEAIWTENSHKYTTFGVSNLLQDAGFAPIAQWVDYDDAFALTLVTPAS